MTYRDDQEQPSKGKQLCNYGQLNSSESVSLSVKWTNYPESSLRSPTSDDLCVTGGHQEGYVRRGSKSTFSVGKGEGVRVIWMVFAKLGVCVHGLIVLSTVSGTIEKHI